LSVNATGIPPAAELSAGVRNDITPLIPLLDDLRRRPGRCARR